MCHRFWVHLDFIWIQVWSTCNSGTQSAILHAWFRYVPEFIYLYVWCKCYTCLQFLMYYFYFIYWLLWFLFFLHFCRSHVNYLHNTKHHSIGIHHLWRISNAVSHRSLHHVLVAMWLIDHSLWLAIDHHLGKLLTHQRADMMQAFLKLISPFAPQPNEH